MVFIKINFRWNIVLTKSFKKGKFEYGNIVVNKLNKNFIETIFSKMLLHNLIFLVHEVNTIDVSIYYDHYIYKTDILIEIPNFEVLKDIDDKFKEYFIDKKKYFYSSLSKIKFDSFEYLKSKLDYFLFDLIIKYTTIGVEARIYISPYTNITMLNYFKI
jgi:hypothetical protein